MNGFDKILTIEDHDNGPGQIKFQLHERNDIFGLHKSLKRHPDIHYMSIKSYDIYLWGRVSRVPLANTAPITGSADRSKRI